MWLVPPGGNPSPTGPDIVEVSPIVFPGSPPVSRALTQTGTWTFVCRLHAAFTGGAWTGMVGTAAVAAGGGSGVDFTEYRVNGGAWAKGTQVTVSGEGDHTVDYRSADKAGNLEALKSIAFGIKTPSPGFPVIEAYADPSVGRRSAAGALLGLRHRSRRRHAELPVGVRGGRGARLDRVADVHQARHVHGDGDRDRRRGRQDHA